MLAALREELEGIAEGAGQPKLVLRGQSSLVAGALLRLNEFRTVHGFEGKEHEIWFYKSVFPQVYALGVYARLKYELVRVYPWEAGRCCGSITGPG